MKSLPQIVKFDIWLTIILNSFNSWKLVFSDPIYEFLWPTILISNFLKFQVKKIVFGFLNYTFKLFPIFNLFRLSIILQVSVIIIIPCHIQVHLSGNNVPAVMPPLNHTSLPFTAATFLATHLMAVLQPSGYSVFYGRNTPIQLSLPWRSCSYQCLNTETSAQGNRGFTTETPSISYIISLYIRLVVTL